ncbi:hypothetical protein NDU88_001265 [Pleurodeles waltl]|uniref:Uncharacterized protein n=1 Tax=Pleurodeles waltl TaxID=8319 RepID=A0AAV7V7B1_PLEWA|nr:hypothetical protein NDU88_001265 [Pleurodeles waltl]
MAVGGVRKETPLKWSLLWASYHLWEVPCDDALAEGSWSEQEAADPLRGDRARTDKSWLAMTCSCGSACWPIENSGGTDQSGEYCWRQLWTFGAAWNQAV